MNFRPASSCICSVIDHRRHKIVVRGSVTHSAAPRVPLFPLPHFDVIWDLLTEQTQGNMESIVLLVMVTSSTRLSSNRLLVRTNHKTRRIQLSI